MASQLNPLLDPTGTCTHMHTLVHTHMHIIKKYIYRWEVVAHAFNLSTPEAEAGEIGRAHV